MFGPHFAIGVFCGESAFIMARSTDFCGGVYSCLDDQPAYNTHLRSSRRILKSAKRHFTDSSLAVAALGATPKMLLNDLNTFGFIFESLCEHDLKIYAEYHDANLFHFRDERGNEADAIVEFPDGTWGAFEVKLGANQIDAAAEELLKDKEFSGIFMLI